MLRVVRSDLPTAEAASALGVTNKQITDQRYLERQRGNMPAAARRGALHAVPEPEPEIELPGVRSRDADEDLAEYWQHMKRLMAVQLRRNATNRVLSHNLGRDYVSVAFLGDTHIGAFIDAEQLEEDIRLIAETDNLYVVFMGDCIDNYKAQGKAATGLYGTAIPSPQDQFEIAKMVFAPLAGKCLAFLAGNHDAGWDYKAAGVSRVPDIASAIAAPYVSEAGAALKLTVGDERYQVNVKHQWRGISQINKSNVTRRFWEEYPEFDSADVVCIGHYHELDAHATNKRGELVHLLRSGTYKVADGYAESAGFKPTYGVPVALFDPHDHRVRVDLSLEDGIKRLQSYRGQ